MSDPPPRAETVSQGYTSPAPPGAGGPRPSLAGAPRDGRPRLSGWWRRAGAALIDGVVVWLGAALLLVALTAPLSIGYFDDDAGLVSAVFGTLLAVLCVAVLSFLYAPVLMARTNGKTLGRMAMGIRVVRADRRPVTFWFAMVREVVVKVLVFGILSSLTFGLASLLDVLWPLWDEERRALHDFVVNSRVVVD